MVHTITFPNLLMKKHQPIALQAIEVGVSAQVFFVTDTVSTD